MKKQFYSIFALVLFASGVVLAQVDIKTTITEHVTQSTSTNKNIKIRDFSQEYLNAVKDCQPFKDVQSDSKLIPVEHILEIIGKNQQGLCNIIMTQNIVDVSKTQRTCSVPNEQLQALHAAMLDKSTTPVTETFMNQSELEVEGEITSFNQQMTMTDSLYNVTLAKIEAQFCKMKISPLPENPPVQTENKEAAKNSVEEIQSQAAEILDQSANKDIQAQATKAIQEIKEVNNHQEYAPQYNVDKLLYAINCCADGSGCLISSLTQKINDASEVKTFIQTKLANNSCNIIVGNVLIKDGKEVDYSQECNLDLINVNHIKEYFKDIVANTKDFEQTEDITSASKIIMERLYEHNKCKPIKEE